MKKLILSIFLAIIFSVSFSQVSDYSATMQKDKKLKKDYVKAETAIYNSNYEKALNIFLKWDSIYPNNANLNYKIGFCYSNISSKKPQAIDYLVKASNNISKDYTGVHYDKYAPFETLKLLGIAYQTDYTFSKAIESYDKYLSLVSKTNPQIVDSINVLKSKCENAVNIINNPVSIKIENLGEKINTEYPEYSPIITTDMKTLYFTSRRESCTGNKKDNKGLYYEDIFYSTLNSDGSWSNAKPLGGKINTKNHEASISVSPDNKTILLYRDDKGDGNIYYSKLSDKNEWNKPVKFPEPINSKYWETHACYSPDMNTIYFVSDRPGGFGGRDIWMSERMGENWSKPTNLGPNINTEFDEDSPYLLPDGMTLYFSSQGHENMGGFDIFTSSRNEDGSWSKPENLGYPINTTEDDVFFVPTPDEKHAYYSSAKNNGFGDQDLYFLTIVKAKKKIIIINGIVADAETLKPLEADIEIISKNKNKLFSRLSSNEKDGYYYTNLMFDDSYEITAKSNGYESATHTVSVDKNDTREKIVLDIYLNKEKQEIVVVKKEDTLKVGDIIRINNILYDFDKASLRPESIKELNHIITILNDYPTIKLEISSHTDSRGSDSYNMGLSERRAESVVNYLIKQGISKDRLVSKGYGESQPIATNSTDEGRQLNRRTEFKIISK